MIHPSSKHWTALKIISSIMVGLFAATQILNLDFERYILIPGFLICILAAYFAIGYLIEKVFKPALDGISRRSISIAILLSLIAGFYLVLTIPLTVYPKPQTFRITATGEQNPLAKSSQVWLTKIASGDSNLLLLSRVCKGSWSEMESALVSLEEVQPASLNCTIETTDDILLEFVKHPWSGEMRLVYGSEKIEADLYSPDNAGLQIRLQVDMTRGDQLLWLLLFISAGISIAIMILAAALLLKELPSNPEPPTTARFGWLGYSLAIMLFWTFMFLIFWPGYMSPDTINQLTQVLSGQYADWHPVFHTLFLWLTTRLAFSPAPADLVQMFALSLLVGWGISILRREGMPRGIAWIVTLFFAFSPAIAMFLLNPWKDTAFSISILAFTLLLLVLFRLQEHGKPVSIGFWVALAAITVMVSLFRHNGALVGFGTLGGLLIAAPRFRRAVLWTIIASAAVWLFVKWPVYSLLNVNTAAESDGENLVAYSQFYNFLRYHQQAGSSLDPAASQLLEEVHIDDGRIRTSDLARYRDELLRIALATGMRYPARTFDYFLDRSSFVFQILQPPLRFFGYVERKVYPNNWGIEPASRFPELLPLAEKIVEISEQPWFDWLFWRNGFWMDLAIFAAVIASLRKRSWIYLILIFPLLLNAIPYVFIARAQARYLLPTLLVGPLLGLGLPFVRKRGSSSADESISPG